jgi:hypothetical protein
MLFPDTRFSNLQLHFRHKKREFYHPLALEGTESTEQRVVQASCLRFQHLAGKIPAPHAGFKWPRIHSLGLFIRWALSKQ